jgi:hypothetical protein
LLFLFAESSAHRVYLQVDRIGPVSDRLGYWPGPANRNQSYARHPHGYRTAIDRKFRPAPVIDHHIALTPAKMIDKRPSGKLPSDFHMFGSRIPIGQHDGASRARLPAYSFPCPANTVRPIEIVTLYTICVLLPRNQQLRKTCAFFKPYFLVAVRTCTDGPFKQNTCEICKSSDWSGAYKIVKQLP